MAAGWWAVAAAAALTVVLAAGCGFRIRVAAAGVRVIRTCWSVPLWHRTLPLDFGVETVLDDEDVDGGSERVSLRAPDARVDLGWVVSAARLRASLSRAARDCAASGSDRTPTSGR